MLVLIDDRLLEVELPEIRLSKCWPRLGCGEPSSLQAIDAVRFAEAVVQAHRRERLVMGDALLGDLAALIVAKTGANGVRFRTLDGGQTEARLHHFDDGVLRLYAAAGRAAALWEDAA